MLTLNLIREKSPRKGWLEKLLAHLGKTKADDEPLSLFTVLESNGMECALWCLRAMPKEYESKIRLLACDFAESAAGDAAAYAVYCIAWRAAEWSAGCATEATQETTFRKWIAENNL